MLEICALLPQLPLLTCSYITVTFRLYSAACACTPTTRGVSGTTCEPSTLRILCCHRKQPLLPLIDSVLLVEVYATHQFLLPYCQTFSVSHRWKVLGLPSLPFFWTNEHCPNKRSFAPEHRAFEKIVSGSAVCFRSWRYTCSSYLVVPTLPCRRGWENTQLGPPFAACPL